MTRDEFIDGYIDRGEFLVERLPVGFRFADGWEAVALPCSCGADECDGWRMEILWAAKHGIPDLNAPSEWP